MFFLETRDPIDGFAQIAADLFLVTSYPTTKLINSLTYNYLMHARTKISNFPHLIING